MIRGSDINKIVQTGAIHALYHKDGTWYEHLTNFPGVLFDRDGYVVFKTESDYVKSPNLRHGEQLNVTGGISSIAGYQKFTEEEKKKVEELN